MNKHEQALQAEARAKAALEEAVARAEAVAECAEAKARQLLDDHSRRLDSLALRMPDRARPPSLSDWENRVTERINKPFTPKVSPGLFREVVSLQAYHKAEQRGFRPGQESDDWLEAERELLPIYHLVNGTRLDPPQKT